MTMVTKEEVDKAYVDTWAAAKANYVAKANHQEAFEVIKQAMKDDNPSEAGSYAHVWHCNIAMMCYDAISEAECNIKRESDGIDAHKVGNDAASRFMRLFFDVETRG